MQNINFTPISFRITAVKNGWLFAALELPNHQIQLANSYLGGLELPGALIKACNSLISYDASSQWLCWHGESHAQIWHLQKELDCLHIKMYSIGTSFGLPAFGDSLAQKVRQIEPNLCVSIDPFIFAQEIYHGFKECRLGDMLAQWQDTEFKNYFPEEEYHTLRRLLRNLGYN